jgi:hypothetical protein
VFQDCYLRIGTAPLAGCLPLSAALIASLYALPQPDEPDLIAILQGTPGDWPWAGSLAVAPEQTAQAVGAMLRQVMLATARLDPAEVHAEALPQGSRARVHLGALRDLWRGRPEVAPGDLAVLRAFLDAGAGEALQPVTLIGDPDGAELSALERSVVARLALQHPSAGQADPDYRRLIGERMVPAAPADTLVGHVQRGLLDAGAHAAAPDDSLCVLAVRDSLTEAEAALAIVQRWLRETPGLGQGDIGIIVPEGGAHAAHLAEVAGACGLVLSGLPVTGATRNAGAELVLLFLQCLRRPVPAMAWAALHANPLMGWDSAVGARMARRIIAGEGDPYKGLELDRAGRAMRALLAMPSPETGAELAERLRKLMRRLGGQGTALQMQRAEARGWLAKLLREIAEDDQPPTWDRLIALAGSYGNGGATRGPVFAGGIAVLHDGELPKRRFRRLLVLGFNDGCYPRKAGGNPLFLDSEVELVAAATGLRLSSRQQALDGALVRFQRQLCAASEQIVLLCSERDGAGKPLVPAASLALIARLVAGVEDWVTPIGRAGVWDRLVDWRGRPEFKSATRAAPPLHYDLGRDLLTLRRKDDGTPRPQSPSRLEKLLVSPLAWVLEELGAKHVAWLPETLDVMGRGTLAHGVFEDLFPAGQPVPTPDQAEAGVPALLAARIAGEMRFLQAPEWEVERGVLQADIIRAARHWAQVLADLGAQVVANEFWLEGELLGHPVHGKADCLLLLGDGQPLVVDHKKSSSGTRRKRLKAGADLQVELYRRMRPRVEDGDNGDPGSAAAVLGQGGAAVAYHMMNDRGVLVNGVNAPGEHLEAFDDGIAEVALDQLAVRFAALRAGQVHTNASADEAHFYKAVALGTYALADSPLVAAFTRDDDTPSAFLPENDDD